MTDLKLTQSFSMISLNAQDNLHMTTAKKAALRCMAAAVVLEAYLDNSFIQQTEDKLILQKDTLNQSLAMTYWEPVLKPLLYRKAGAKVDLKWWLKKASILHSRQLIKLEHAIAASLNEMELLEVIPNLLGCDLYYDSAGVEMKEYRSNVEEYTRITENIRAEILEEGSVTDETICMLWLLRESGCMHDLFSQNELEKADIRMNELYQANPLAQILFVVSIHHGLEIAVKKFLYTKKTIIKTPSGSRMNFAFPFLERSQSVFIETEAWFSNSKNRLEDVKVRLESKGHLFTVLHEGQVPLIKIDNLVYQAVPHATYGKVPIHGVRILPKRSI